MLYINCQELIIFLEPLIIFLYIYGATLPNPTGDGTETWYIETYNTWLYTSFMIINMHRNLAAPKM